MASYVRERHIGVRKRTDFGCITRELLRWTFDILQMDGVFFFWLHVAPVERRISASS